MNNKNNFDDLTPSQEQTDIINNLLNQKNVLVQAVAGAGKTSIALFLAKALKQKYKNEPFKILHLTYNKELKDDNAKKIADAKYDAYIDTFTIHGYANMLALQNRCGAVHNEATLKSFLKANWELKTFYPYIIIDEVQDANSLMVSFFKQIYQKTIKQFDKRPVLLILGDDRQMLYANNGASSNYLKHFDTFLDIDVIRLPLKTSFRVPKNICNTLNKSFLKQDVLVGYKDTGQLIIYAFKKPPKQHLSAFYFDLDKLIYPIILAYIKTKIQTENAKYDDFFILGFSIKTKGFKNLEHYLVSNGVPVYYPLENSNNDKNETTNKVAFSSINQAKGRERKYVILPYFDVGAYKNWLSNSITNNEFAHNIPNLHYVALTRSTTQTLLFCINALLPSYVAKDNPAFIKCNSLLPYIDYKSLINDKNIIFKNKEDLIDVKNLYKSSNLDFNKTKHLKTSIESLCNYIDNYELDKLTKPIKNLLKTNKINDYKLILPSKVLSNNKEYQSSVILINGLFLFLNFLYNNYPSLFKNNFLYYLKNTLINLKNLNPYDEAVSFLIKEEQNKDTSQITDPILWWKNHNNNADKLKLSCLFLATTTQVSSISQLPVFNWLDEFKPYHKLDDLFKQFQIKDASIEIRFVYELTPYGTNDQFQEQIQCYFSQTSLTLSNSVFLKELDNDLKNINAEYKEVLNHTNLVLDTRISLISNGTLFNFDYNLHSNNKYDDTLVLKTAIDTFILNRFQKTLFASLNYAKNVYDANKSDYYEWDVFKIDEEEGKNKDKGIAINSVIKDDLQKRLTRFYQRLLRHTSVLASNWQNLFKLRNQLEENELNQEKDDESLNNNSNNNSNHTSNNTLIANRKELNTFSNESVKTINLPSLSSFKNFLELNSFLTTPISKSVILNYFNGIYHVLDNNHKDSFSACFNVFYQVIYIKTTKNYTDKSFEEVFKEFNDLQLEINNQQTQNKDTTEPNEQTSFLNKYDDVF